MQHPSRPVELEHAPWQRPVGHCFAETSRAAALALVVALPFLYLAATMSLGILRRADADRAAAEAFATAHARLVSAPALDTLPLQSAQHGFELFLANCAVCHARDGRGVAGLGKGLIASNFVAASSDADLLKFLIAGRPANDPLNTTRVEMPPRGGNPALTDADLADVVFYMRGLQDPRRLPPLAEPAPPTIAAATDAEKAAALAAAGGDEELAEIIAFGAKVFATSCVACHGRDAHGLKGLGTDLVASVFIKENDDDALLAFIKRGRDPSDPANTTGVGMPAKGGNPALDDDDILDVIEYLRSLQRQASAAK